MELSKFWYVVFVTIYLDLFPDVCFLLKNDARNLVIIKITFKKLKCRNPAGNPEGNAPFSQWYSYATNIMGEEDSVILWKFRQPLTIINIPLFYEFRREGENFVQKVPKTVILGLFRPFYHPLLSNPLYMIFGTFLTLLIEPTHNQAHKSNKILIFLYKSNIIHIPL